MHRRLLYVFFVRTLTLFLLQLPICLFAQTPSGDSYLHLGSSGYATRTDATTSDLDYTKSFSFEAIVYVAPNSIGGRWASIIGKSAHLFDNSNGFALGFNQGHFATYGQQLYAKIGDGVTGIQLAAPKAEGNLYGVVTWNVGTKTLTLFLNGKSVATKSASALNQVLIKNTKDLGLGLAGGYKTLDRDLLLARIWNRELSTAEVQTLYSNFAATGSTSLPSLIDRSGLFSEWLMRETSNALGAIGISHIRDTAGVNHLALQSGAGLVMAGGSLVLESPVDGASEVSPAIVLKASGGISNFAASPVGAISYNFQVDENATFDSPAIHDSGWIRGASNWQPVLKPETTYYWRVRLKDSATSPLLSQFSKTSIFKTRAGKAWWARPGVYTGGLDDYIPLTVPGTYGNEDGTSYQNAWNGNMNIIWGERGVAPGDSVYVCGKHLYEVKYGNFFTEQVHAYIKQDGYSTAVPVTIRMDCPGDEGTLWGSFLDNRKIPAWSGPDSNGVYSTIDLQYGAAAQKVNGDLVWLDAETAPTWPGHLGARYFANGTTYLKTVDGSAPTNNIFSSSYGPHFDLSRRSYIRFYHCNFMNSGIMKERVADTVTVTPPSHDIIVEESKLKYGVGINLYGGHNNWVVRKSDISMVASAIYAIGNDLFDGVVGARNLLVEYNNIYDTGTNGFEDNDCHGIGVQSGDGHIIQGNKIWNTGGTAIEFWTGSLPMRNMIVRNNFIKDIAVRCLTSSSGIVVSGDNQDSVPGLRTGYQIYNNIIVNTGIGGPAGKDWHGWGIGSNSKDSMEVYNNVLYHTHGGISATVIQSLKNPNIESVQGTFYNNMIISPWGDNPYVALTSPVIPTNAFVDYNLYFPATATTSGAFAFYPNGPGASWANHDSHSRYADPKFMLAEPSLPVDFELQNGSPAIDAGKDVGIASDFFGTQIPQGAGPDIGAIEYRFGTNRPPPPQNIRVTQ